MEKTIKALFCLAGILCCTNLLSQVYHGREASELVPHSTVVRLNPQTNTISFVGFDGSMNQPNVTPETFLKETLKPETGTEFRLLQSTTDQLGIQHFRYQQYWNDIIVEDRRYYVHIKNGRIQSANGDYMDKINLSPTPSTTESLALQSALAEIQAKTYAWEAEPTPIGPPAGELVLFWHNKQSHLAYKFDIEALSPHSKQYVYVSATNRQVLAKREQLHTSDVPGTAVTMYRGAKSIIADSVSPGNFRLRESGRGGGITTLDLNNSTSLFSAIDFTDTDNLWNTTTNLDNAAYDAHWGAEMTYDFFNDEMGWNSYDNLGSEVLSYIHYGSSFFNAFWNGSAMVFGDGNGTAGPLTSIDIVAHEFTHGVTEFSAGLVYQDEPGALNESFSDILGLAVDYHADSLLANYQMGEEIGFTIRDAANPNLHSHPDTYHGTFWYFGSGDFGGVHTNSGVMNHWYYLLVEGGSGTNDIGNSFTVAGIGRDKVNAIAFRNLTQYLTPNSQYADARFYAIQAANDLYGPCSAEATATAMAWYAVGVGTLPNNSVQSYFSASETFSCTVPTTITFDNQSINGMSYLWDFGDGTTSTAVNPSHTYTSADTFTVSLITTGSAACGSGPDTTVLTDYITITNGGGPSLPVCSPLPINISSFDGITSFSLGTINHSSGITGNGYDDYSCQYNTNLVEGTYSPILITTSLSSFTNLKVWIDFNNDSQFSSNEEVFVSSNTGGSHSGNVFIPGSTVLNTSLRMRVMLQEGSSVPIPNSCHTPFYGEVEDYTVIIQANTSSPVVDFTTASQVVNVGQAIAFTDLSSGLPSNWYWEFPGGTPSTSTLTNPTVTYTSIGMYDVKLKAVNSFGEDSLTKVQYISVSNSFNMCAQSTANTPSGLFYDSGGPTGNYSNGENCSFLIDPFCATDITLTFSAFLLESCCDYVSVYDGVNSSAPLLFFGNGSSIPPPLTANSGKMFISFTSDGSVTYSGWAASWTSTIPPGTPPVADFSISDTTPALSAPVQFTDLSQTGVVGWTWNFGDGNFAFTQDPIHAFSSSGTYTISLIADNCVGLDTTSHTVVVQQAPSVSFSPDSLIVTTPLCNDSLTIPMYLYNTGIGDLYFDIEGLSQSGSVYDSVSYIPYSFSGASTYHFFSGITTVPDSLRLIVRMNGDFDSSFEFADLYIDGTFIAQVEDFNVSNGTDILDTFSIQHPLLPIWLQDDSLLIELDNSSGVNLSGGQNFHEVSLYIEFPNTVISTLPDSGLVVPGDSMLVNITFNGNDIPSGSYHDFLEIITNDPNSNPLLVPTLFEITAPAGITVPSATVMFDPIQQFLTDSQYVSISNPGCDTLLISNIISSNPIFSSSSAPLSILPGDTDSLLLLYQPLAPGTDASTITLMSNVPDTTFSVNGTSLGAPSISVAPDTLSATIVDCDDSTQVQFTIYNTGIGDLDWQIDGSDAIGFPLDVLAYQFGADLSLEYPNLIFGINQYFTDYQLTTTSTTFAATLASELVGKDIFLVPEIESTPLTHWPSFAPVIQNFVSNGGRIIFCGSGSSSILNTPILSSGLISGTHGGSTSSGIFNFPNPSHPLLDSVLSLGLFPLSLTALISTSDPGVEVIASIVGSTGTQEKAIFKKEYGDGDIIYIGHDFFDTSPGLNRLIANAMMFRDITDQLPDWLTVSPDSGTVAVNDSVVITVTMSAEDLEAGVYSNTLSVLSNDPLNPTISIEVEMTVIGSPDIDILYPLGSCLEFPIIQQFDTSTVDIPIINSGCADLNITSLTSLDPEFAVQNQAITIEPGDTFYLPIDYIPTNIGASSGSIMVMNNAGDTTICVSGFSIGAPVASVLPNPLIVTMAKCDSPLTVPLMMYNNGLGPLQGELSATASNGALEDVLVSLDSNFQAINSLVPNRYDFFGGDFGNSISDGGGDMYDGGNTLSTTGSFPFLDYSDGIIQNSTVFGTTGRYFTRKYPGLFILAADLDMVNSFYITGNLGADGSGIADGTILTSNTGGSSFKGFVKRVYNAGDPSVNHLIIIEDDPSLNHSYSTNTNNDEHIITGLNNSPRLYYLLFASINGGYIDDATMLQIMETFIQNTGTSASWVSYNPLNQFVAPGDSVPYFATFTGGSLENGVYQDQLQITTNDPANPMITVPVLLQVIGTSGPTDALCNPDASNTETGSSILSFAFNTILNTTSELIPLEDFTCTHKTEVLMGDTYNLLVSTGTQSTGALGGWIDYNDNGIFELSETVIASTSATNTHLAAVTIPFTAVVDRPLRLRIGVEFGVSVPPSSCASIPVGQFEEYTVIIRNPSLPPIAGFSSLSLNDCQGIFQFSDVSTNNPTSWEWDFGDGFSSTLQNPVYAYSSSGIYDVSLITGNAFGQDTAYFQVEVSILEADFTYSGLENAGDTLSFAAMPSQASSYSWDFGDGQTSNAESPEIVYAASGSYDITLTVIDSMGCRAVYTSSIEIGYPVNVGELSFGKVSIYPNPTSQSFWLDYTGAPHELSYQVYNQLGQIVLSGKITDNLGSVHQQLHFEDDHARGVYTMKVRANGEVWSTKVVHLD